IQGFVHFAQDVQTATLRLFQRDLHDLFGDAGNLDVHLQRGDTVGGAGDLEVHIAEMIFVTQDVRQNDIAMAFHDEAHGDARRWLLQGNARIHQRQRGAAHGRHRGRSVRLRNFGDDAQRVGELFLRRQHRMDRAPGELAMTDLAAARGAHAARFTHTVGRKVVVQHEGLLAGAFEAVDKLFVFRRAERANHQRLRFAAREQRRTVRARQDADFGDDRANRDEIAAVDARLGVEHRVAHDLGFEVVEEIAKFLGAHLAVAFADEIFRRLLLDLGDAVAAFELDGYLERAGEIDAGNLLDLFDLQARVAVRNGARFLRGLFGEANNRVDGVLHFAMTEHHGAEHGLFVQLLRFGFDHQNRIRGSGDDQFQLGIDHVV